MCACAPMYCACVTQARSLDQAHGAPVPLMLYRQSYLHMLLIQYQRTFHSPINFCLCRLLFLAFVSTAMPGVSTILTAADIPAGGKNDIGANPGQEKMFLVVGDSIACIGQSVALVLADTFEHALAASRAVVITATAPATAPIFTIQDAITASSFFPSSGVTPIVKGDVNTGASCGHRVHNGCFCVNSSFHFQSC